MASFDDHLARAKANLIFLENVCRNEKYFWDWKVTICFYSAVHLINAHIADKSRQHYRSHEQVLMAINPNEALSLSRLDEAKYLCYSKLRNLSRRSRYLVSDQVNNNETGAFFTYDKHFARAIRHLDVLITFFNEEYKMDIQKTEVTCIELKQGELVNFLVTA